MATAVSRLRMLLSGLRRWFVRPGELRQAEWSKINFDAEEWRIPDERMKMGELHIVPLATQAIEILRRMLPLTGTSRLRIPFVADE